jgi:hypothetical protein
MRKKKKEKLIAPYGALFYEEKEKLINSAPLSLCSVALFKVYDSRRSVVL